MVTLNRVRCINKEYIYIFRNIYYKIYKAIFKYIFLWESYPNKKNKTILHSSWFFLAVNKYKLGKIKVIWQALVLEILSNLFIIIF